MTHRNATHPQQTNRTTASLGRAPAKSRRPLRLAVLGTSIKTCPLDLREPLAFPPSDLEPALQGMTAYVAEGAILSTCHRVELYAAGTGNLRASLARFWSDARGVPMTGLREHAYYLEGEDAVRHLFSVASGLESAIFGEPQILGQVRDALDRGLTHDATGPALAGLLRHAVLAGKRVRTETAIGRSAASVSYAAVELARATFGDLRSSRVLLVGTGKMGELAARNLLSKGVAGLAVVGRTPDRARQLALECGSQVALAQLESALPESDIVISCTSAPHQVISRDMVEMAMRERRGRPLFLIDIAVPRDIEPAAKDVQGVHLYNIDDLEAHVASNMRGRRREARLAATIIEEEVAEFQDWLAARSAVPTIAALRQRAERIRHDELARSAALLARLPEADRRRIEALTLALEKKLLHAPIALLRAEAASGSRRSSDRAVRQLFALDS